MEIEIRIACEEDAADLLEIYAYYVKNTAITFEHEVPTLEEFTGRIRETLKNYPYLVALIDGRIVGYIYAGIYSVSGIAVINFNCGEIFHDKQYL